MDANNRSSQEISDDSKAGGSEGVASQNSVRNPQIGMGLKEQLVIWKRSGWLLDNIVLTPKLCDSLVEQDIFTAAMMAEVQVSYSNQSNKISMIQ